MFYHVPCTGNVVIKTEEIQLGADNFGIDVRNGVVKITSMCLISPKTTNKIPVKFFCTRCQLVIEDKKELYVRCSYCGKERSAEDVYVTRGSGGVICKICKKKYISSDNMQEKDFTLLLDMFTDGIST